MNKLITIVLIMVLILPAAALADESDVIGCWAHYEVLQTGAPSVAFLYLAADHTCYYLIQSYRKDEAGIGRTHVGTWEMLADGSVSAKTGNRTETVLAFPTSYGYGVDSNLNIFVNITAFKWE